MIHFLMLLNMLNAIHSSENRLIRRNIYNSITDSWVKNRAESLLKVKRRPTKELPENARGFKVRLSEGGNLILRCESSPYVLPRNGIDIEIAEAPYGFDVEVFLLFPNKNEGW